MNFLYWLSLTFFSLIFTLYSHDSRDFQNSLKLHGPGEYEMNLKGGAGRIVEPTNFYRSSENDFFHETNSKWLNWTANVNGKFTFEIIPHESENDFDFVLYKVIDGTRTIIREMYSGRVISDSSNECLGSTGLSDDAQDTYEGSGCNQLSDNYLASVLAEKGEEYFLLVNNFNSKEGFTFLLDGSIFSKTIEFSVDIFPNPASENIILKSKGIESQNVFVSIYDIDGRLISMKPYTNGLPRESIIDLEKFNAGIYNLVVTFGDQSIHKKFVKQ